jgi:hypothetical protein
MNRLIAVVLLAFSASAFAQTSPLHSGSTVYIEPMDGYETYLSAAIVKKHAPLIVVTDKTKADFVITSTVSHKDQSQPVVSVSNTVNNGTNETPFERGMEQGRAAAAARRALLGITNTSISVIDPKSSQIVFAYSAGSASAKQFQSTAEDCAKHLKEFIEKAEKPKK